MSEPMPTIPTQSPFTYPNPNPSASPSFTQDDTSESFIPEPTQPMPTFTQTTFTQPAFSQPTQSIFSQTAFTQPSVRVKKCFVCGSKLHLIKDCDFYNCVDSVPCKSKAASVPAGSRNSSASVTAGGSDPAASRNRPAVNSAGRPNPTGRVGQAAHPVAAQSNPAGWSKRPAPVSAGRPVSAGWLNPAARPYFRPSSVYLNNMYWPALYDPMYMNKGQWGTAVKTSAGYSWRNKRP
ncbi:hypothetical protein Tco_0449343, partial [Tanacetum coccineum]